MTRAPARFEPGETVEYPGLGTGVVVKATTLQLHADPGGEVVRAVVLFDRADEPSTHYVTPTTRSAWQHVADATVYDREEPAA